MKISRKVFGLLSSGKKAYLYTLKAGDLVLTLSSFGADWVSLKVPSRKGPKDDVLLGFSTLEGYTHNKPYFGATVGRVANRIGGCRFSLNGLVYSLYDNDHGNTLHGGRRGFDKRLWKTEAYEDKDGVYVRFELKSPDMDEGFPGKLKAAVSYGLTKSNEIVADYQAACDKPCPVNLTNHAYFNLAGEGSGDILGHEVKLFSSSYVEAGENLIPTGKLRPVLGGPYDFTEAKKIGRDIEAAGGYDHCFVISGEPGTLRPVAEVSEEATGRSMKVFTTQPAVHFYSGNFLDGVAGKAGSVYEKHGGFCLETEFLPDSPNRSEFPPCIFGPSRKYHEKAVFSFDW